MAKIRVYELARDLNLKNKQLIEFILKETDVKIMSHMSSLSNNDVQQITRKIRSKRNKSEKPYQKTTRPLIPGSQIRGSIKSFSEYALEVLENRTLIDISERLFSKRVPLDEQISKINNFLINRDLVLVLGAGVSVDHNLPDWDSLLQKLLISTIQQGTRQDKYKSKVLSKIFTSIFPLTPLIAGRYLQNFFMLSDKSDDLKFEKAVRNAIYSEIDLSVESNLFKEIRQFCIAPGNSPNLDSIITYNFDDLLEKYLNNIDIDILYESIYAPGMNPKPNSLPIYHVHGYLPEKVSLSLKNKITLSEDIYHQQYSDIYGWSNLVQLNKFNEKNCLFIGTSLTDPNLRRLLDISTNLRGSKKNSHYYFKRKHNPSDVKEKLQQLLNQHQELIDEKAKARLDLDESVSYLINIIEDFEIKDAKSFGADIIWVTDYSEIPNILRGIRNKAI